MDRREHWNEVYLKKGAEGVSWYQPEPTVSYALIRQAASVRTERIFDIGGGASTLVDTLLRDEYSNVTVLDLSAAALAAAKDRLGAQSNLVRWMEADVLTVELPEHSIDLWHDRAVFHFFTATNERERYIEQVRRSVRPGGHVLVATFAKDGPTRCSGLEVARYAPGALHQEFGRDFRLLSSAREIHVTPAGVTQAFTYCMCRYEPVAEGKSAA